MDQTGTGGKNAVLIAKCRMAVWFVLHFEKQPSTDSRCLSTRI